MALARVKICNASSPSNDKRAHWEAAAWNVAVTRAAVELQHR